MNPEMLTFWGVYMLTLHYHAIPKLQGTHWAWYKNGTWFSGLTNFEVRLYAKYGLY